MKGMVLLFLVVAIAGCSSSPPAPDSLSSETGGVTASLVPEATGRSVSTRFPALASVVVELVRSTDNAVLRTATLTVAAPTTTFAGIAAGTSVFVRARAYDTTGGLITTGQSAVVTIVAGANVSVPLQLLATTPQITGLTPANGSTVNSSAVVVDATVSDVGGGVPSSTLKIEGVAVDGAILGNSPAWAVVLADGAHTAEVASTTTSGGSAAATTVFAVSTTGGVVVGIESLRGGE